MNSCKIRFDVTLSQKYTSGRSVAQQFKIVVGIKIYQDANGNLLWEQLDTPDTRIPPRGTCERQSGGLALYGQNPVTRIKEKVAALDGFEVPSPPSHVGYINFEYVSHSYQTSPPTVIRWKGTGKWTLLHNSWVEGSTAWGGGVGMATNWQFITSQGASAGGGPGWTLNVSGGDIIIADKTDPRKQYKIMYGGIGGGIGLPKSPGGGVSGSTFDFPSGGLTEIYYGTRSRHIPMRIQDFVGHATFVEITGTYVQKWLPKIGKFPGIKSPVGVGASITATVIFFYVPPAIGVIPAAYGAAGIMWGLSATVGNSIGGSATLYHGYVSTG